MMNFKVQAVCLVHTKHLITEAIVNALILSPTSHHLARAEKAQYLHSV